MRMSSPVIGLSLLGAFAVLAFVMPGAPASAVEVPPAPGPRVDVAPPSLGDREANAYYQDCLRRRDAGDMKCGESCFWKECLTCNNVCTLNCVETFSCG